jgi:iron(III) transport system permease protein
MSRAGGAAAVLAASALAGGLVVLPLFRLGQVLWQETGADLLAATGSPGLGRAVRNTVVLAVAVPLAAVPVGVAMALVLRRRDLPGRWFWRGAVLVPLVVPDFVLGYSWTQSYARGGFTDTALGLHWSGLLGPVGVWLVLVVNAAPLVCLVVAAGLAARGDLDAERAARVSGAGSVTTLLTVTLRLLLPAIAAASVLVFVLTLGTFAIPQVLGAPAGFHTVTTRIYADLSIGGSSTAFAEAVALALLLAAGTAICVAPADTLLGPRLRTVRPADPQTAGPVPERPGVRRAQAAVLGGYLVLTTGLPLVALALASVTRAVGVAPTPGNWTLDSFRRALTPRTAEALGRTLGLAMAAATLLVLLGGLVAVGERRRAGRATATLMTLTLVLPGSTLAVGMLITYGRWLSGSVTIILLAYLAKLWAFGHRPIAGALDRLPPDEVRAARSSGAGPLTAVRTVVLRPLAPALLSAFLLCFLTVLHEITMSSLLYGPGSETLAVIVLNTEELGRVGPTAALSVALSLLVGVPALLLWVAVGRLRVRAPDAPVERTREVARAG